MSTPKNKLKEKQIKSPKLARKSIGCYYKGDEYNYFTESSEDFSDSGNEEAKNAIDSIAIDLNQLNNVLILTNKENTMLKEQLRLQKSENINLTSKHSKRKRELEQEISDLKHQLSEERLQFKNEIESMHISRGEIEQQFNIITQQRKNEEQAYKKNIQKLKDHYCAMLEEKDKKLQKMNTILRQTKNLDRQVKKLLDSDSAPQTLEKSKSKRFPHTKSASQIPYNDKLNELCKTIVDLEREQAELKHGSPNDSSSVKVIMKSNEGKIQELRNIQERLYHKAF